MITSSVRISIPIYPATTAYFDRLYGPRHWSPPATTLNFSIGQGENTQTLINMMRFYEGLTGDGNAAPPFIVRKGDAKPRALGLSSEQLDGLRRALIAVVERGTAAASRHADLAVAGKTGTAQNPHGKDHGWFIGFAPAEKPELNVGGIMEFAEHGTTVAPYVIRTLRRYILGPDTAPHLPTDRYKLEDAVSVPAKAGDVVVFSIWTIHGSSVNHSGKWRRSVRMGYRDPRNLQVAGQAMGRPGIIVKGVRPKIEGQEVNVYGNWSAPAAAAAK